MTESADQKFVDHPAPSIGLITLLIVGFCALLPAVLSLSEIPGEEIPSACLAALYAVLVLSLGILGFYFWPLYTTYYTVDKNGIMVKYGPWRRVFRWEEFKTVYWQTGMFATKIGWPSVTPCVRLSNGLLLPKKNKVWGLYLTPNNPEAFIEKIEMFAPELTKEMIR